MARDYLAGIAFLLAFTTASAPAFALDCSRPARSLPRPLQPAGLTDLANPIQHIVVLMQENHSFDSNFGHLNQPQFYGKDVDGLPAGIELPAPGGRKVRLFHQPQLCVRDPQHSWNAEHYNWNNGRNDGFLFQNPGSDSSAGYFDHTDIPYYYELANRYAIADRYFCSVLGPTFPNRYFLMTASAFGQITNIIPTDPDSYSQPTIFDRMNDYGVDWTYYSDDTGYLKLFGPLYAANTDRVKKIADYLRDLEQGTLPEVVFIDASFDGQDEHPDANVQIGQAWVQKIIGSLMKSSSWRSSAVFFTYDENGGFFDHVPPPSACAPDAIQPELGRGDYQAGYDRYGFRVPFILVSPYAKRHYVSHQTYDHTSILKFIEYRFNLPALTRRDANADAMLDLFDFSRPDFRIPSLPSAAPDPRRSCQPVGGDSDAPVF